MIFILQLRFLFLHCCPIDTNRGWVVWNFVTSKKKTQSLQGIHSFLTSEFSCRDILNCFFLGSWKLESWKLSRIVITFNYFLAERWEHFFFSVLVLMTTPNFGSLVEFLSAPVMKVERGFYIWNSGSLKKLSEDLILKKYVPQEGR